MDKVYTRINWINEDVSQTTPLGATNLNKIDYAVDVHDDRIISLDITKASESDALTMIADVSYNASTGVFTFTRKNGTEIIADLNIEKIPVSFSMSEDGVITMVTSDGSTYTADVGALIKTYTFNDSTTIDFTTTVDTDGNKVVTADIIDGSITGDKLQPNYLADCITAKNSAEASATNAAASALEAQGYAQEAAEGSGGNALGYTNNVLQLKRDDVVLSSVTIQSGGSSYSDLTNKPSINGVTLEGNKTTEDLLIEASSISSYDSIEEALADTSLEDGEYFSTEEADETEPSATILDTVEDVLNNTEPNQIMGALVGKELLNIAESEPIELYNGTNTLNDSIENYRYLIFVYTHTPNPIFEGESIYTVKYIKRNGYPTNCVGNEWISGVAWYQFLTPTTIQVYASTNWVVGHIYGIK